MFTRPLLSSIFAILLSGALFYGSTGFNTQWYLLWLAPIPVLIAAYHSRVVTTLWIASLAFLLGQVASTAAYLTTRLPAYLIITPVLVNILAFALIVLATRYAMRQLQHVGAVFIFPALWVSYEYVVSLFSSGGELESLAYSQLHFVSFIQIVSITGIWGAIFCVFLFAAAISAAVVFAGRQRIWAVLIAALSLLLPCAYGYYKMNHYQPQQHVKVGLLAVDKPITAIGKKALPLADAYVNAIPRLMQQDMQYIIFPEKFLRVDANMFTQVSQQFRQAAQQNKVNIIAGFERRGEKVFNSAVIYRADGKPDLIYDKHHLLPGLEAHITPGKKYLSSHDDVMWGVGICKDMDFASFGRAYGRRGVQLLFVPALDFKLDKWLHANSAIMRGIESGYSMAACGQLGIDDSHGSFWSCDGQ